MMARRVLSLRYAATCADCGARLEAGARARYYGPRQVYGVDCHANGNPEPRRPGGPVDDTPGALASYHDPRGAYAADGTFLGTVGPRCEDAPCCGCCS